MAEKDKINLELKLTGETRELYKEIVDLAKQRSKFDNTILDTLGGQKDLVAQILKLTERTTSEDKKISKTRREYDQRILESGLQVKSIREDEVSALTQLLGIQKELVPYAEELVALERLQSDIKNSYVGANAKIGDHLREQVELQQRSLIQASNLSQVTDLSAKAFESLDESTGGVLGKFPSLIRGAKAFTAAMMLNPIFLIGTVVIAAFALLAKVMLMAWKDVKLMNEGIVDFRKETGLAADQTERIERTANRIFQSRRRLFGDDIEKVYEGIIGLEESFSQAVHFSDQVAENAAILNANLGISGDVFGEALRALEQMGGHTDDMANGMLLSLVRMAKINDVAPSKVFKEMAESSGELGIYLRGNTQELQMAAIHSRRLGINMSSLAGQTASLLDFQTSISAEMEASAIIGRQLDFSRARTLGFAGRAVEMNEEITRQVMATGDWESRNAIAKEAIARAAGITAEEMSRQIFMAGKLHRLNKADQAVYRELTRDQQLRLTYTDEEIRKQLDLLAAEQNLKTEAEKRQLIMMEAARMFSKDFVPIMQEWNDQFTIFVGKLPGMIEDGKEFLGVLQSWVAPLERILIPLSKIAWAVNLAGGGSWSGKGPTPQEIIDEKLFIDDLDRRHEESLRVRPAMELQPDDIQESVEIAINDIPFDQPSDVTKIGAMTMTYDDLAKIFRNGFILKLDNGRELGRLIARDIPG